MTQDKYGRGRGSAGTARVLREMRAFTRMEEEYGEEVAVSITTRAVQRFDQTITSADVRGTVKVLRALSSGEASLSDECGRLEAQAEQAAAQLFQHVVGRREGATQD